MLQKALSHVYKSKSFFFDVRSLQNRLLLFFNQVMTIFLRIRLIRGSVLYCHLSFCE